MNQGERQNKKLHSINSEEGGKQTFQDKDKAYRKSGLQRLARNNESQVNVNPSKHEVDAPREASSSEERDSYQAEYDKYGKLPDP